MPYSNNLYGGLDVQNDSSAAAYLAKERGAEVVSLGTTGTRQCDIDALIRRLHPQSPHLIVVYDGGPCGWWLYRDLTRKGSVCWVMAPSLN